MQLLGAARRINGFVLWEISCRLGPPAARLTAALIHKLHDWLRLAWWLPAPQVVADKRQGWVDGGGNYLSSLRSHPTVIPHPCVFLLPHLITAKQIIQTTPADVWKCARARGYYSHQLWRFTLWDALHLHCKKEQHPTEQSRNLNDCKHAVAAGLTLNETKLTWQSEIKRRKKRSERHSPFSLKLDCLEETQSVSADCLSQFVWCFNWVYRQSGGRDYEE